MIAVYGQDCSSETIVGTEAECRKAGAQLHVLFRGPITEIVIHPAGCYAWSDNFSFNTITDPSRTKSIPNDITGICKGITIYIIFDINIHFRYNFIHLKCCILFIEVPANAALAD